MADSLCGVPCRDSHCSAHNGVGGGTAVEQVSQQVLAASSTRPEECCSNYLSPKIYPMQHRNDILRAGTTADDNGEVIITKNLADAIRYKCESLFGERNRTRQMKHRTSSVRGEQRLPFHHHLKIVSIADLNRSKLTWRKEE